MSDQPDDKPIYIPPPTIIGFETGAIIFPLGVAIFAQTLEENGIACDAINIEEGNFDVFTYSAKDRDWVNLQLDKVSNLATIGPKKQS